MSGTANPIPGEPPLQVRTSYELPRDEAYLLVTTTYTNPSKDKSASLLPGDIADWGALSTFAEGMGAVNDLAIRQARFVAGIDEDVTVAFLNTNGAPLEAIVAQRLAVIQHYGPAVIPDIVLNQLDPI
jgi:hypothetical protein